MLTLSSLEKAIHGLEEQKQAIINRIHKSTWGKGKPPQEIPAEYFDDLMPKIGPSLVQPARRRLPADLQLQYQRWYSASRVIIEKNQPSRLRDFDENYTSTTRDPSPCVSAYLADQYITAEQQANLINLIERQSAILAAVPDHVRFSLYDIELTAYSVLMDDGIEASRHLLSRGFLRPAGALAGVILERHLKMLLTKHSPPIKYGKNDALSKLNDLCKESIYDIPTWRKVQLLTDLRNLCDHDKGREPKNEEVSDLIDGVSAMLRLHAAPMP